MAAHYGYVAGTKGADGDGVDCFVGVFHQSEYAYVVNQNVNGVFDEHKIIFAYPDEESARRCYRDSYDRNWPGFASMVTASISQIKWWLKHGNMKKPLHPDDLPPEGLEAMSHLPRWSADALPTNQTIDQLLYDIRRSDHGENLMLDSVTLADIMEDADGALAFDALVVPFASLERKMAQLQRVMERASLTIKPVAMQVTEPFSQRGVANVATLFELSDGQTVSIYFHNPDVTPKKIMGTDEVISWKWLLNKKDITIVVAPERGNDLNISEVARRIMKLAEKNSAAFQRVNAKKAESMQRLGDLKTEITGLEKELKTALNDLEVAKIEQEDRVAKAVETAKAAKLAAKVALYEVGSTNAKTGRWNRAGILSVSRADGGLYLWSVETSIQRSITNTVEVAFEWLSGVLSGMGDAVTGAAVDRAKVLGRLKFKSGEDLLNQVATPEITDLSYRDEGMFTTFMPNTKAGEDAWRQIAEQNKVAWAELAKNSGLDASKFANGKVLSTRVASTIAQLRKQGYTVSKGIKPVDIGMSDDEMLAELGIDASPADAPVAGDGGENQPLVQSPVAKAVIWNPQEAIKNLGRKEFQDGVVAAFISKMEAKGRTPFLPKIRGFISDKERKLRQEAGFLWDASNPELAAQIHAEAHQQDPPVPPAPAPETTGNGATPTPVQPPVVSARDDGDPIELTGKELGDFPESHEGRSALRDAAMAEWSTKLGKNVFCAALDADVELRKSKQTPDKFFYRNFNPKKLKTVAAVEQLISLAKKFKPSGKPYDSTDKGTKLYHYLRTEFKLDGEDLAARMVIKEDASGLFHYDHTVHPAPTIFDGAQKEAWPTEVSHETHPFEKLAGVRSTLTSRLDAHLLSTEEDFILNMDSAGGQDGYALDAVESNMVLNLFLETKDENGNWVPMTDTPAEPINPDAAPSEQDLIGAYAKAQSAKVDKINAAVAAVNWPAITNFITANIEIKTLGESVKLAYDTKSATSALEKIGIKSWDDRLSFINEGPESKRYGEAMARYHDALKKIQAKAKEGAKEQGIKELSDLPADAPIEDYAPAIYKKNGIDTGDRGDYFGGIVEALQAKDADYLRGIVGNTGNKASREIFERYTGLKLAKTKAESLVQVDAWAGITPEQRAQIEADKEAAYQTKNLAEAVKDSWNYLTSMRVNSASGSGVINGQEYVLELASSGNTEIKIVKKGVALIYGMVKPSDGSTLNYLKTKSFTGFLKAANKFGGLQKAFDLVGAVVPRPSVDNMIVVKDVNGVDVTAEKAKYDAKVPTSVLVKVDVAGVPEGDYYGIELRLLRDGSFNIYHADGSVVLVKGLDGQGDLGGNADRFITSSVRPKGMTEDQFRLAQYKQMKVDLASGIVKPSSVIGGGHKNPRKDADNYLDQKIAEYEGKAAADAPIELTGKELGDFPEGGDGYKAMHIAAVAYFEDSLIGKSKFNASLKSDVFVRKSGSKKIAKLGSSRLKMKLVPATLSLIGKAVKQHSKPSTSAAERNIKAYHYMRAEAKVGEEIAKVWMIVKEDDKGMFLYEEFVNKGALTGIAGVAPTLDSASLDGPALYQGTDGTLTEFDEAVNDTNAFDESEVGEVFEPEFTTLDSATGSQMVFNLFIEGEEPEVVEFEDDEDATLPFEPAEPTPEPIAPVATVPPAETPASLISGIKAHYVAIRPFAESEVPADWLIMNAPRPLLGTKTIDNGEFLTGRFYAAIDPYDSMAAAYIKANIKQAAEMVLVAEMPVQIEMALEGAGEYRAAYEAMPTEKRANAVKPLIRRIQGKPYAEAKAFLEAARASVGVREPVAPIQAPAAAEPVVQQVKPITELKFDQWAKQEYDTSDYKDAYLEAFEGSEGRAMLGLIVGENDNALSTPDLLKQAKQKYISQLLSQPRDAVLSLDVWGDLTHAQKADAQKHFYDLDERVVGQGNQAASVPPTPATRPPGGRARPTPAQKTPNEIAAEAEHAAFTSSLKAKGGKFWASEDMKKKRYYFERTSEEYAAEIATLREAAGGSLAVWPGEKLGYVDVNTREFVSTRAGVSNANFKASLGFSPTPPTESPQMTADKAFLQSVIDGTVITSDGEGILSASLFDPLEAIYKRYTGNTEMQEMLNDAVNTFTKAELAASAHL